MIYRTNYMLTKFQLDPIFKLKLYLFLLNILFNPAELEFLNMHTYIHTWRT